MKRSLIITFALLLTIVIIAPNSYASEYEPTPTEIARQYGYPNVTDAYQPEGSINVSQTGQILYDYQSNQNGTLSMTKLMTMYLTLEVVNKGELSLNDKVHITDKHYRMSTLPELSNTKLYAGETYTISELLQITVSNSSNALQL